MEQKKKNSSCSKCKQEFNLTSRIPRLLSQCGHTLCQECIYYKIVKSNVSFQCPVDLQHFKYKENDVQQFIKNYEIIKTIKEKQKKTVSKPKIATSPFQNRRTYSSSSKPKSWLEQKSQERKSTHFTKQSISKQNSYYKKQYSTKSNILQNDDKNVEIEDQIDNNIKNYNIENSFTLNLLENSDNEFTNDMWGNMNSQQNYDSKLNGENIKQLQKTHSFIQRQNILNSNRRNELKSVKCSEHNKEASQFCLDHQVVLCPTCIFLGKHKNHQIIEEHQIINDLTQQTENLIKMLQKLEVQYNIDFKQFNNLQEMTDLFVQKEQTVTKNIKIVFNNFRNMINSFEQKINDASKNRMELIAQQLYIIQNLNIPKLEQTKNNWKQKTQDYIKEFINQTSENQIPFKLYDNKKLQQEGILLQNDIEKLQKIDYQNLQQQLNKVKVQFNKELLNQMVILYPEDAKQRQMTQMKLIDIIEKNKTDDQNKQYDQNDLLNFNFQNSGLLSFQNQQKTIKSSINCDIQKKKENRSMSRKSVKQQDDDTKSNKTSFSQLIQKYTSQINNHKQSIQIKTMKNKKGSSIDLQELNMKQKKKHSQGNNYMIDSCNFDRSCDLNKMNMSEQDISLKQSISSINFSPNFCQNESNNHSKENIKEFNQTRSNVPDQKLKRVIEQLKNNEIDTIDLTCAKLGNEMIHQLKHYIATNLKLKSIKLVQNNLTDEIAESLFLAIKQNCNIQHINLSLNQMTDKTVLKFHEVFRFKCHIRNVYFNQNKIKQNKVMTAKRDMKRLGVNIYT